MSSVPPTLVPPTQAITPAGRYPAARSSSIARCSAVSLIDRQRPPDGMRTRFSSPMPDTQIARSIDVCTSVEA
jgi:hypothetical protein